MDIKNTLTSAHIDVRSTAADPEKLESWIAVKLDSLMAGQLTCFIAREGKGTSDTGWPRARKVIYLLGGLAGHWEGNLVAWLATGKVIYLIGSCLLYTSPSPRDKRQSRMPSSA